MALNAYAGSATTQVWLSGDRVIVCGYSRGPVTWTLDGDITAVAASASAAELGAAVHGMLARPARTVEEAAEKPLLSAARVRSYRQLEREYALVSVDLDGGTFRFDAWRPDGGGLVPTVEFHQRLEASGADHAAIGRMIRVVAQHSVVRRPR
jgi:hypothetical protein